MVLVSVIRWLKNLSGCTVRDKSEIGKQQRVLSLSLFPSDGAMKFKAFPSQFTIIWYGNSLPLCLLGSWK
uniref:Uncharacterized protein n=1 Tax=Rhizophora mucronata TaxID=61149 RepID=A0A2P2QW98_RHIMU